MTVAIDGNYRLRRLKRNKQGTKKRSCSLFFGAYEQHDEQYGDDVENNLPDTNHDNDESRTSNFDAANLSLQAIKNKRVHESGVVGSVCKHNIPLEFTNMYNSGERYKYPLSLLNVLKGKYGARMYILYDIGCGFSVAVDKHFEQLKKDGSKVDIGIFHAYGHSMAWQIYNNPRYIESFGLERLWSDIGKLVTEYYTYEEIAAYLRQQYNRAVKTEKNAVDFIKKLELSLNYDQLKEKWYEFVKEITFEPKANGTISKKALVRKYANDLHELYNEEIGQHKLRALENFEEVLRQRKILIGRRWAENSKVIKQIENKRVKDYAKQQCMSLEAALKKNDPRAEGWNTLLYHRLQEAEAFCRNVHSARWNRDRGVVVPGSGYLEEINNLSGVIDEVEGEVVEEDKDKNEDEDEDEEGQKNKEEEVNRLYNEIENQVKGDESDEEQEDEDNILF
ncbi:hypothetical protein BDA99DRAFT_531814 [Phascolomyces articulosus]|uniref:Uncharacterized protein n=1 Tax=Phascolomyces articulosus TaxID=60185 RepID=A0AAD5KAD8_9FUNG|nr:hypothetical protein BDA99DRAFT_531814 [Phascolomyces articulosus]